MTEEVINALAQIPALRVTARTSAFAFRGKECDVREIGQKLNVATLLEGSVRRAGNRVRITAQLIDVSGGHHIWSERFDRELEDVFAIQDEIAQAIAVRLSTEPAHPAEGPRFSGRLDVEAYDTYLRGRYHRMTFTPDGMEKAIVCYNQSLQRDPDFAPGHAALAEAYTIQSIGFSMLPSRETMPKARSAADRALQIDASLAEAQLARALVAMFYEWDYPAARRGIEHAIAANPNSADAHFWYEFYWTYVEHRFDEATAATRRAIELDPLTFSTKSRLAFVYYLFGHLDEGLEQCRQMIDMDPSNPLGYLGLADVLGRKGRFEEAVTAAERCAELGGGAVAPFGILGISYAAKGDTAKARNILAELTERSKRGYVSGFWLAAVHAGLGDMDGAFGWLAQAKQDRDCNLLYLTVAPRVIGLHQDPRYEVLLHDIGLGHLVGVQHS
jgi:serine/threonine-protein kinase